jgi:hypothetical protein
MRSAMPVTQKKAKFLVSQDLSGLGHLLIGRASSHSLTH